MTSNAVPRGNLSLILSGTVYFAHGAYYPQGLKMSCGLSVQCLVHGPSALIAGELRGRQMRIETMQPIATSIRVCQDKVSLSG